MGDFFQQISKKWQGKEIKINVVIEEKSASSNIPLTIRYQGRWRRKKKAVRELFDWLIATKQVSVTDGLIIFLNADLLKYGSEDATRYKIVKEDNTVKVGLEEPTITP